MNSFSCVITGHRPTRFKFKYNEKDKRCQRIKKCLQEQLIRLYHQGVRCFWVGGAMGVDMWAAEILLRMKEQQTYQDVELCLALPFEGYDSDWDDWHRKRMDFICRYAEKVLVLGEMPSSESYKKRNYYMVEQAGHMIAVYVIENGALLEALQKLNERERQIFLARTLEEEDFETLGVKFELSYKGAAALYYRTIQKIRKSIEGGDKR